MKKDELFKIAGVSQTAELERFLWAIVSDKKKRLEFYGKIDRSDLAVDSFREYFEEYAAERKSFQQDYTPDSVAILLSVLTRTDEHVMQNATFTGYDATAGTGALIVQKWFDDKQRAEKYSPSDYFYRADELADNAVPYLIHNLAMRGMNAVIVHGDVLQQTAKQVYLLINSTNDPDGYSDVNIMPHTKEVAQNLGILGGWLDKEKVQIETDVITDKKGIMGHKALEILEGNASEYIPANQFIHLKDIADIERAKTGKKYPAGTIVVQISATRGQIGLLKSSGEVQTHYACINLIVDVSPKWMHTFLQIKTPPYFARVQNGLNLTIPEIENIPIMLKENAPKDWRWARCLIPLRQPC